MDLGLVARACIITGASGGIGRATAERLAAEGASLLLVGRREDALRATAEACRASARDGEAVQVQTLVADLTQPAAAEEIVQACRAAFGRVDVLVNNAGTTQVRAYDEIPDAEWQEQWELHVMAPMRLMRAAVPIMAAAGWGRIVNVSSSSGKRPSSMNMAYGVTKAAELSLSRAFAEQVAARGVLVNAVTPGPVAGEIWTGADGLAAQLAAAGGGGQSREDVLRATGERLPLGRMGTNDEIAAVIVFLCSELASNVVGVAWSVDGGAFQAIL